MIDSLSGGAGRFGGPARSVLVFFALAAVGSGGVEAQQTTAQRLTLADAVALASRSAPSVAIAGTHVDEMVAEQREVRSALLPRLDATGYYLNHSLNSASFGFEFPSTPGSPVIPERIGPFATWDARAGISQRLVDLAAWKRVSAAGMDAEVADAERDVTRDAVAGAAARAYVEAARAAATAEARAADVALATELRDLAQNQLDAGIATAIDITRARSNLLTAESRQRQAVLRAEQAQIQLARAMGVDPSTRFALADALGPAFAASESPEEAEAAYALALTRRKELKLEDTHIESARLDRAAIRAERLPRLEMSADYGFNGPRVDDGISTRQVQLRVAVPILDGLGREARIEQEDARIRGARLRADDIRQGVKAQVESALLELSSGLEQQRSAEERVSLANEEVTQARARFENGIAGNIELIDAQASLNAARDAVIEARYQTAIARVDLARATGTAQSLH